MYNTSRNIYENLTKIPKSDISNILEKEKTQQNHGGLAEPGPGPGRATTTRNFSRPPGPPPIAPRDEIRRPLGVSRRVRCYLFSWKSSMGSFSAFPLPTPPPGRGVSGILGASSAFPETLQRLHHVQQSSLSASRKPKRRF